MKPWRIMTRFVMIKTEPDEFEDEDKKPLEDKQSGRHHISGVSATFLAL